MTPIRCRWHDAGVIGVPPNTPGKQAAAAFALYGLRLQAQGIAPGPVPPGGVRPQPEERHPVNRRA